MTVVQWYDTTFADREIGSALRVLVIPSRSILEKQILESPSTLMARLELRHLETVPSPSLLPGTLASILVDEHADLALMRLRKLLDGTPLSTVFADVDSGVVTLAEHLALDDLVPFEGSPLHADSLVNLAGKSKGLLGLGAVVGLVASGPRPLVLITVPLGIVLCGAAAGVAKALSQGLHYQILKLLGLPQDEAQKASLSDASRAANAS